MIGRKKGGNYAFIDSQNLNVSVQNYGWKMNWRKFREFLAKNYDVSKAYMFIGYVPENEELYEQMHQAGYAVVLKQIYDMTRPRNGENGHEEHKKPIKGNVDADLVLWAMKELPNYDKAIIVSGDGDFHGLIEYLDSKQKLAKILTPTGHYSSLFHQFQSYVERLDDHRRELAYYDKKQRKPISVTTKASTKQN